jgi:hypothetical protein
MNTVKLRSLNTAYNEFIIIAIWSLFCYERKYKTYWTKFKLNELFLAGPEGLLRPQSVDVRTAYI